MAEAQVMEPMTPTPRSEAPTTASDWSACRRATGSPEMARLSCHQRAPTMAGLSEKCVRSKGSFMGPSPRFG